jgi:DNA-binding CsgD family transcriptional regulator
MYPAHLPDDDDTSLRLAPVVAADSAALRDAVGHLRAAVHSLEQHPATGGGPARPLSVVIDGFRCTLARVEPSPVDALSPREREIARMVGRGYTNRMIADVLAISSWTVSTHLRRIFAKLGVQTRAAMVAAVVTDLGDDPPR